MAMTVAEIAALKQSLQAGFSAIEVEVQGEKAASLGHHGRQVEKAMTALRAFDAEKGSAEERLKLVKAGAREVWSYFVQREMCGVRDHREAIRIYGIPNEVLVRLGAVER